MHPEGHAVARVMHLMYSAFSPVTTVRFQSQRKKEVEMQLALCAVAALLLVSAVWAAGIDAQHTHHVACHRASDVYVDDGEWAARLDAHGVAFGGRVSDSCLRLLVPHDDDVDAPSATAGRGGHAWAHLFEHSEPVQTYSHREVAPRGEGDTMSATFPLPPVRAQDHAIVSWGLDRIDDRRGLDNSYEHTRSGAGVHVYVLDTGIVFCAAAPHFLCACTHTIPLPPALHVFVFALCLLRVAVRSQTHTHTQLFTPDIIILFYFSAFFICAIISTYVYDVL
jgi:hypothetical protein